MTTRKCSICDEEFTGMGCNPQPILPNSGLRCCDECDKLVIFIRYVRGKNGFNFLGDDIPNVKITDIDPNYGTKKH